MPLTNNGSSFIKFVSYTFFLLVLILAQSSIARAGTVISGQISLPHGEIAPAGGVSIAVRANNRYASVTDNVTIAEGGKTATFNLNLPDTAISFPWVLYYSYQGQLPYLSKGAYSYTRTALHTTWDLGAISRLAYGKNHTGLELTLLSGNRISGLLMLPGEEVAPVGGIDAEVFVDSRLGMYRNTQPPSVQVHIPEGAHSAPYILAIPPRSDVLWDVYYTYSGPQAYVHTAKYSETNDRHRYLESGVDHEHVDLQIQSGNMIRGMISLPAGEIAPSGGVAVEIKATIEYEDYTDEVLIEAGASSVPYSLVIPQDPNSSALVSYTYSGVKDYLPRGYFSNSGTVWNRSQAFFLQGNMAHSDVDLQLLTGNIISGTISLPFGEVAPAEGISIRVSGFNRELYSYNDPYKKLVIDAGNSSVAYTLIVPPSSLGGWRIRYGSWQGVLFDPNYLDAGYYSAQGTVSDPYEAQLISGGSNHSGIDLTVLHPPGYRISGRVSLPEGDVAPLGGLPVCIHVFDTGGISIKRVCETIKSSQSSVDYVVYLDAPPQTTVKIGYKCGGNEYVDHGYYSLAGSTWDLSAATGISAGQSHANIDLSLFRGNTISGVLSLPSGEVAPLGGLWVTVRSVDENNYQKGIFRTYIPAGDSTASYAFRLSPDPTVRVYVSYEFTTIGSYNAAPYLEKGYFSSFGTIEEVSSATPLSGGLDHDNINLTLLPGTRIHGVVSLPAGRVAPPNGISVDINARYESKSQSESSQKLFIDEGETSASYHIALDLAPDETFSVYYGYLDGKPYSKIGYFRPTETIRDFSDRSILPATMVAQDINLTLIERSRISGTISLPNGEVAPPGGMNIDIYAKDLLKHQYSDGDWIYIPEGESAQQYSMYVSSDPESAWQVEYSSYPQIPYRSSGYYAVDGTVLDNSMATLLSGGMNHSGIDMQLIKTITDNCLLSDEYLTDSRHFSGNFFCSAESSITAGNAEGVVVEPGGYVILSAPLIRLSAGFTVRGGMLRVGSDLLPP